MGQSPSMGLLKLEGSAAATSALGAPCRRFHSCCSAELAITSCSVRVLLLPLNTCIAVCSEVCLDRISLSTGLPIQGGTAAGPSALGSPCKRFSSCCSAELAIASSSVQVLLLPLKSCSQPCLINLQSGFNHHAQDLPNACPMQRTQQTRLLQRNPRERNEDYLRDAATTFPHEGSFHARPKSSDRAPSFPHRN